MDNLALMPDDHRPVFSLGDIYYDHQNRRYETDTHRFAFKSVVEHVLNTHNIDRCHSVSFRFLQEVIKFCLNNGGHYYRQFSGNLYNALFGLQIHQNTYPPSRYLNNYINKLNAEQKSFVRTMNNGSSSIDRRTNAANRFVKCMNSHPYNLRIPPAGFSTTHWNGWNRSVNEDYDPTSWILLNNNGDVIRSSRNLNCNIQLANEPLWQTLSGDYQQVCGQSIPVPGQHGFYLTYLNDSYRIDNLKPIANVGGAPDNVISKGLSTGGEDFIYSSNNNYPRPAEDPNRHSNEDIYYVDSAGSWQLF